MALIATEQGSKMSVAPAIYAPVGPRKDAFHGKSQLKDGDYSTDGLPKAFLHSLRTLFDILDDAGRGYVHISEIESRWQGADTRELPGGVLSCLRRVTPPHGCLTFERFVAGLRYSMLNPENRCQLKAQAAVPPQPAPRSACTRVEKKVRPLGPSNVTNIQPHRASSLMSRPRPEEGAGHPVCGPARYGAGYERPGRSLERIPAPQEAGGSYRVEPGHVSKPPQHQQSRVRSIESLALESPQLQASAPKSTLPRSQSESATGFSGGSRRHSRGREEQRRHTITNGVDYEMADSAAPMVASRVGFRGPVDVEEAGPAWTAVWAAYTTVFIPLSSSLYSGKALHFFLWLKQMKELEQEKDSLLAGLEVVERARDWYQGQIHNVTERQRQVGQNSQCTDFFTEANQSRINILIPKLQEVNRSLNDLICCTGMSSFPSGGGQPGGLATTSQPPLPAPPQAILRLKDQNRLLTQEVTEKSERIAQLEQEKSALIKQLFDARSRSVQDTSTMDSTFI